MLRVARSRELHELLLQHADILLIGPEGLLVGDARGLESGAQRALLLRYLLVESVGLRRRVDGGIVHGDALQVGRAARLVCCGRRRRGEQHGAILIEEVIILILLGACGNRQEPAAGPVLLASMSSLSAHLAAVARRHARHGIGTARAAARQQLLEALGAVLVGCLGALSTAVAWSEASTKVGAVGILALLCLLSEEARVRKEV